MTEITQPEESPLKKENIALRKKIDELEQALGNIEAGKSGVVDRVDQTLWQKRALFMSILLAGIIPAYFVMQDRWFGKAIDLEAVDKFWQSIPVLR